MAKNKGQHKGHVWLMLIGCIVMLGGIFLIGRPGFGNLGFLFILLCPLMHIFMMRGHMGHQHHEQKDGEQDGHSLQKE